MKKPEINADVLNTVVQALDTALDEFRHDDLLFNSMNEILTMRHSFRKNLSAWKKGQKCIVQNCSNKSIERSHTIQKAASIKSVSEHGHVYTPSFNMKTGLAELSKEGINDASTFPGFCSQHERLFEEFETSKNLSDGKHALLQIYRTICREIVILKKITEEIQKSIVLYIEYRDATLHKRLNELLGEKFINDNSINLKKSVIKGGDYREKMLRKKVQDFTRWMTEIKALENATARDLKNKKFSNSYVIGVDLNYMLPFTLAGRSIISISVNKKQVTATVIINILPFPDRTTILISGLAKFKDLIDEYCKYLTAHPLNAISCVESWMINGSDHWFIQPSIWDAFAEEKKIRILNDIQNMDTNMMQNIEYSIFDDVRKYIADLMSANFSDLDDRCKELLSKENAKLTYFSQIIEAAKLDK